MRNWFSSRGRLTLALALLIAGRAGAQGAPGTAEVFSRYGPEVITIHIVETGSGSKSSLATGFFATADGRIITNYHVVADVVNKPKEYRAEWVETEGATHPLRVLAIDVVHDLAVVSAGGTTPHFFALAKQPPPQGTRLFALGNPNDIGLSIVEGTYNGLMQNTLYPKIHFTGAINHGMSGGPAITAAGLVVGINVQTRGNSIGFLVPVDRAAVLLARTQAPGYAPPTDFFPEMTAQIRAYQDLNFKSLFADSTPMVMLGTYNVPTKPAGYFRCWADADRDVTESPFVTVDHNCSTDDEIYLAGEQTTGEIHLSYKLITTEALGKIRFYTLYASQFDDDAYLEGTESAVTRFECRTRNLRRDAKGGGTVTVRAAVCLRAYKKLTGLYDAVVRTAVLGSMDSGLVASLSLTGVSYENAQAIIERFLERVP
jgi:hypothetical protein